MVVPARLLRVVEGIHADMRTMFEVAGVPVAELLVSSEI